MKPEGNGMRSRLATRAPNLSSSCSASPGKSLGLSFPVCKMEITCPVKLGPLAGWSSVCTMFGAMLVRDRVSPE